MENDGVTQQPWTQRVHILFQRDFGIFLLSILWGKCVLGINCGLIGRHGLGGLRPKRCYCGWVSIYAGWLAGWLYFCLIIGFRPHFHSVWSHPLCNCLVKKINQGTDVLTASSFSIMCSHAHMYKINYIDPQSQDENRCGQLAVGIHPFDCKYLFYHFQKC